MSDEIPVQTPDGQPLRLLILCNDAGMVITLMGQGATLLSVRTPFSDDSVCEALLGYTSPEQHPERASFPGASISRCTNRIANSRHTSVDETVELMSSQGEDQLHGGPDGFDKHRWQTVDQSDRQALFAPTSDDGDQGFPGHLCAITQYYLTDNNRTSITYRATVSKPYPMNLTDHVYLNLDDNKIDMHQHELQIMADEYLSIDEMGIPHDRLKSVAGSGLDLHVPEIISSEFLADDDQHRVKGYDHAFLLQTQGSARVPVTRLWSQDEKLQIVVYISAPALQFCSGNFLSDTLSRGPNAYED